MKLSQLRQSMSRKEAFVPSPQTQQQVQAAAQGGQAPPPEQDANSNAVSPGGIVLDDVAAMLEQMHGDIMQSLTGLQNQMSEMRAALPGPSGEKAKSEGGGEGGDPQLGNALERIAQLEQLLNGMQSQQAQGAQAAEVAPQ